MNYKIENNYYLSDGEDAINQLVSKACGLITADEVEELVGRFSAHSSRAGQLRGEVLEYFDGSLVIRHHFSKKVLWSDMI